MSISGRIKPSVKASLPKNARGALKTQNKVSFKNHLSNKDDLDQDLMEINSNLSEARINAQIAPIRLSDDNADSLYETKSPSVYAAMSGSRSALPEKQSYRYQVPKSAKVEKTKDLDLSRKKKDNSNVLISPKASLTSPVVYKPDYSKSDDSKNNFFKKPSSAKLEVSGVNSNSNTTDRKKISDLSKENKLDNDSNKTKVKNLHSYPGQNYADQRLKKLLVDFVRKDMPVIDDHEFLIKEQTKAEEILEKNFEEILKQHDNDRGGGDHGPCYLPGQLLEKFPFPKKGTQKKDFGPIDFNQAKPIFGDANVPKQAFNPKGIPQDHTTTYRVGT